MKVPYDSYYLSENLFGNPYPELIAFFTNLTKKGKVLDLGCGQGRNAIPLARLGYSVTGMDNSKIGIEQMIQIAASEKLQISGEVIDIYTLESFNNYDVILLDSMFHFSKNDLNKETRLIKKILSTLKEGAIVAFFVQDTGHKLKVLNNTIDNEKVHKRIVDKSLTYIFKDEKTNHTSKTEYRMVVVEK